MTELFQGEAVNEKVSNRKREAAKRKSRRRDNVLRQLLSNPEGRGFLWDELVESHVFTQTLDLGVSGHAAMAFKEGQRSAGLRLFNDIIRLSPENYFLMTKENSGAKLEDVNNERLNPDDTDDAGNPSEPASAD